MQSPGERDRSPPALSLELSQPPVVVPRVLRGPLPLFRRRLRRRVGRTVAAVTGAFGPTPLGRWLHRRLHSRVEFSVVDVELGGPGTARWPTIAFVSDVHAGHYMGAEDLGRLARLLAGLAPDLICLGGDLINHHLHELDLFAPFWRELRPPLGILAVPGNHDYVDPEVLQPWVEHLERRGVHVLLNRGRRLEHAGGRLWVAGVDDLTEGRPELELALRGREPGEPTLLLSHHPDLFEQASQAEVDLQLSGHTHGGQLRFLGWAPLTHTRRGFVAGLYERNGARLYVGRGAGVTLLPLRLGTRSEIALLRPGPRPRPG